MQEIKKPGFSLLIPFRNRDKIRVQHCLDSLQRQSYQDFELIFLDYGSEQEFSTEIKHLLEVYPFCRYFYSESRGFFWNRSAALNQTISLAKAEKIIFADIDLIFSSRFLEFVSQEFSDTHYLRCKFYDLPKNFKDFDKIIKTNELAVRETTAGLLLTTKHSLEKCGAFDTFYRVWGVEDRDLALCLESWGLKEKIFDSREAPVFHQWHPKSNQNLPKGWLKIIDTQYSLKKKEFEKNNKILINQGFENKIYTISHRPALQRVLKQDFETGKEFQFQFPKENAFAAFYKKFQDLEEGDYLFVKQKFSLINLGTKSRIGKWIIQINHIFQRLGFSYRLTDIYTSETEIISIKEVQDFLFYFVLYNEAKILDYYIESKEDTILFLVFKQ